ncbi:hypothetical protein BX666DRAFT_1904885 [Dichotomocladium elegans]|nr:hypothetical protein BX666DRAFT_1904885 [Dichotomocladium elegans]
MSNGDLSSHTLDRTTVLYEELLKRTFLDSASALDYCRKIAVGWTVSHDPQDTKTIRVCCSYAGSEQQLHLLLYENQDHHTWAFSEDWPLSVTGLFYQLVHDKVPAETIRQTIQSQYPALVWDDAVFAARIAQERTRGVRERCQRLVVLSARLCAMVAANEEWTRSVEQKMAKMMGVYDPSSTLSAIDMPHPVQTIDPSSASSKKKNDHAHKGIQLVEVPPYTVTVQQEDAAPLHQHHDANGLFAAAAAAIAATTTATTISPSYTAGFMGGGGGVSVSGGAAPHPSAMPFPFAVDDTSIMAVDSRQAQAPLTFGFYPHKTGGGPSSGDLLHH